ncbi:PDR/VanB family oxidoreductase [Streptomyces sp. 8L]|uniref:PDR/VanB family oxidoreductase n=1 Tax=Streptomyces sp. 8L TaxID=2877242 RepID=UPI001CD4FD5A|nr:PDR/VanB family oxidoreductase [Streptomyces sp. 8L]MCA1218182.1 PDR/VanB family oxidoreductase [Streptomyces sp. 8L]
MPAEEPRHELLVHRMTREAEGVLSVELSDPGGKPLPPWEPGAHLDIRLGEHLRQYSLCGDPADAFAYRVAILDEPSSRGGSRYAHTVLRPGDTVTVTGPRNHFALEEAPAYVFVAGGIGITPILAMARAASRRGVPYTLVHGGRTRTSMAFGAELAELARLAEDGGLSGHRGGSVVRHPQDEKGHIDLDAALSDLPPGALVYCCGPEPLLAAVEALCPPGRLRVERFSAPAAGKPRGGSGDTAFEVECRASGVTVGVDASTSVLDAVRAAGIAVASSCEEGICGTCETRVLAGVPDHRDLLLSDGEHAAGATMMICVSRCASDRLVLDL